MIEQVRWFDHDDNCCEYEAAGYEVVRDGPGCWTVICYRDNRARVLGSAGSLMAAKAIVERDIAARRTEVAQ